MSSSFGRYFFASSSIRFDDRDDDRDEEDLSKATTKILIIFFFFFSSLSIIKRRWLTNKEKSKMQMNSSSDVALEFFLLLRWAHNCIGRTSKRTPLLARFSLKGFARSLVPCLQTRNEYCFPVSFRWSFQLRLSICVCVCVCKPTTNERRFVLIYPNHYYLLYY